MPKGIYQRTKPSHLKKEWPVIKCSICKKEFQTKAYRENTAKFCSQKCYGISCRGKIPKSAFKKGQHISPETEYKKGHIPFSKLHPEIMRKGEEHYAWKFDRVGYQALHSWVRRKKGNPEICNHCGSKSEERLLNWANKSHKYLRDLSDWISLCIPCHKKYDKK